MPLVWTFCRFSRHFKHPQISIFHSSIFYQFAALSIFQYLLETSPLDDDIAQWCSNIKSQNRFQFERIKVAALQILPKWSNAHWVVRNCGSNLTLGPSDWVSQSSYQFHYQKWSVLVGPDESGLVASNLDWNFNWKVFSQLEMSVILWVSISVPANRWETCHVWNW